MSYLLTFAAGMAAMLAALTFAVGIPMEAAKYAAIAVASLAMAWVNRPVQREKDGVRDE